MIRPILRWFLYDDNLPFNRMNLPMFALSFKNDETQHSKSFDDWNCKCDKSYIALGLKLSDSKTVGYTTPYYIL